MPTPSLSRRTATSIALAALAVATVGGLSACTGDTPTSSSPTPSASSSPPSASATPTGPFAGSDQSAVVLALPLPPVKGTTKGKVGVDPATLNVAEVRATSRGTLLTFWFTGEDTMLVRQGERSWENWPTLVDPDAEKVYEPLTFVNDDGDTLCLCTDAAYIRGVAQPRTVYYPQIPASVTSIQVRQAGFTKPVTIEVTRP